MTIDYTATSVTATVTTAGDRADDAERTGIRWWWLKQRRCPAGFANASSLGIGRDTSIGPTATDNRP